MCVCECVFGSQAQVLFSLQSANSFTQTIVILDCNDEPPVFTATQYQFSMTENSAQVTVDTPISSTDGDITVANQAVTYHLTDGGGVDWLISLRV